LIGGREGVDGVKFRPSDRSEFSGAIEFHGARSEWDHCAV
jgi:hypothetical protein